MSNHSSFPPTPPPSSFPYPPQPRRLMRDPSNKVIGGVCSGVAKYLNMDVNLVRVLTVVISLFTGVPIVLYLIALFVLPEEGAQPPQPPHVNGPPTGNYGSPAGYGQPWQQQTYAQQGPASAPAPAPGPTPSPAPGPDPVWGAGGAPWEQPQAAAPDPQSPTWPAPATAAPEETPEVAPATESLPETEVIEVAPEDASTWESAPAEPASAASEEPAADSPEEPAVDAHEEASTGTTSDGGPEEGEPKPQT